MILVAPGDSANIRAMSHRTGCPYDCSGTDICAASLSSMTINSGSRQIYCSTENYDNCPVFLAKMLRRR
jgi:hypothetical protein